MQSQQKLLKFLEVIVVNNLNKFPITITIY